MANVQQIIDQHRPTQTSARPAFQAEWKDSLFFVVDPKEGGIYELPITEDLDLSAYPWCIAILVKKSNHRDFPRHRFLLGTLLENGRFVTGLTPRVENQRLGQADLDNTWPAVLALVERVQVWHGLEASRQADAFLERKGGDWKDGPPKGGVGTGIGSRTR